MAQKPCCTPTVDRGGAALPPAAKITPGAPQIAVVKIPGGAGLVGTDRPYFAVDGEAPSRATKVKSFYMMPTTVTNAQFQAFVADTGYVTEAERWGWSMVFHSDVPHSVGDTHAVLGAEWWRRVDGADWRQINGPGTAEAWHADHPVVQVSWADARAFAKWAGGRLPTEIEWEHAARGGLGDVPFAWGAEEPQDDGPFPCNIWQGRFPHLNRVGDGYAATAPAQSFAANGYGLFHMCGNVWEWTADVFKIRSMSKSARAQSARTKGQKTLKGGSFLCHRSYCYRYRIAARTGNTPDSATPHQGFRLVFDRMR